MTCRYCGKDMVGRMKATRRYCGETCKAGYRAAERSLRRAQEKSGKLVAGSHWKDGIAAIPLALGLPQQPEGRCWIWQGEHDDRGYPKVRMDGRWMSARVLAFGGEVPRGRRVTSTCKDRRCCNPEHLRCKEGETVDWDAWEKRQKDNPPEERR